jgi:hypothetical protein
VTPFPAISGLLHNIDDVFIDEKLDRHEQVRRHLSDLGSILQNSISAGNFSDRFSSPNLRQISTHNQQIEVYFSIKTIILYFKVF